MIPFGPLRRTIQMGQILMQTIQHGHTGLNGLSMAVLEGAVRGKDGRKTSGQTTLDSEERSFTEARAIVKNQDALNRDRGRHNLPSVYNTIVRSQRRCHVTKIRAEESWWMPTESFSPEN